MHLPIRDFTMVSHRGSIVWGLPAGGCLEGAFWGVWEVEKRRVVDGGNRARCRFGKRCFAIIVSGIDVGMVNGLGSLLLSAINAQ